MGQTMIMQMCVQAEKLVKTRSSLRRISLKGFYHYNSTNIFLAKKNFFQLS